MDIQAEIIKIKQKFQFHYIKQNISKQYTQKQLKSFLENQMIQNSNIKSPKTIKSKALIDLMERIFRKLTSKKQQFPIVRLEPSFLQYQPVNKGNTARLSYQQLKAQKINSLHKVKHKNGSSYESTLQDGNKFLMPHNPNNNNEKAFTKKNICLKMDIQINETKSIKVLEVQSIQGQSEKFNIQSISAHEMNYQLQYTKILEQIGGVIAGTLGSLTADCIINGIDAQHQVKDYQLLLLFKEVSTCLKCTIFWKSSSLCWNWINSIYDKNLSRRSFIGIEGGMGLGALGGPIRVVIDPISGASDNLLGRATDHFTQFTRWLLNQSRITSQDKLKIVKEKVKILILIAQTDTFIACLIPSIDRNKTEIQENEEIGIQFNEYKYIGYDASCQIITFRLLATTEDEILQQFQNNETNIIDIAQKILNNYDLHSNTNYIYYNLYYRQSNLLLKQCLHTNH
ncbi:unnamed protein product [Paramecium primaurelia]|uniref:Uncharacterized protein n=1 Tax=Paramecium primaurelia TaxID=5886 RepID=A0A8S1Q8U2_PARPR|nr:unnamed protein product [Paramecium primaurelia]